MSINYGFNNVVTSGTLIVANTGDIQTLKLNTINSDNLTIGSSFNDDDIIFMISDPSGLNTLQKLSGNVLRNDLLNQPAQLQFRQGTDAERLGIIPASGEPLWVTDTQKFYIGDGTTIGGDFVGPSPYIRSSGTQDILANNSGCLVDGDYSVVLGGYNNVNAGYASVICGGHDNNVDGDNNNILGGTNNTITDFSDTSFIGGGSNNNISGDYAAICGGSNNQINPNGRNSSVCGGLRNTINGEYTFIGGGIDNTAGGNAFVGGGVFNNALSTFAIIAGGYYNQAGSYGFIGGGANNNMTPLLISPAAYSVICGGVDNSIGDANQHCFIGGGYSNYINVLSNSSFIGGGFNNETSNEYTTVIGGQDAIASVYGEDARSSGKFANKGDAQVRKFILRNSGDSEKFNPILFADGSAAQISIPENSTWLYTGKIVGRHASEVKSYAFQIEGVVERSNLTTLLLQNNVTEVYSDENTFTITPFIDESGATPVLSIKADGYTESRPIYWVAYIELVQVIAPTAVPSYS